MRYNEAEIKDMIKQEEKYVEGMKYILKYYEDMRMKKTEDAALRACWKEVAKKSTV